MTSSGHWLVVDMKLDSVVHPMAVAGQRQMALVRQDSSLPAAKNSHSIKNHRENGHCARNNIDRKT